MPSCISPILLRSATSIFSAAATWALFLVTCKGDQQQITGTVITAFNHGTSPSSLPAAHLRSVAAACTIYTPTRSMMWEHVGCRASGCSAYMHHHVAAVRAPQLPQLHPVTIYPPGLERCSAPSSEGSWPCAQPARWAGQM